MSIKITHSRPELIIFFFITSVSSLLFAITLFFKQQVDYSESSYFITSTSHMHLYLSVLQNQVYIYSANGSHSYNIPSFLLLPWIRNIKLMQISIFSRIVVNYFSNNAFNLLFIYQLPAGLWLLSYHFFDTPWSDLIFWGLLLPLHILMYSFDSNYATILLPSTSTSMHRLLLFLIIQAFQFLCTSLYIYSDTYITWQCSILHTSYIEIRLLPYFFC